MIYAILVFLLALGGGMLAYDHLRFMAPTSRRSKVVSRWLREAKELRDGSEPEAAPMSDVCFIRKGPARAFGFFRPEVR
jgi:hypothetical protein